jgi:hypothetical protein
MWVDVCVRVNTHLCVCWVSVCRWMFVCECICECVYMCISDLVFICASWVYMWVCAVSRLPGVRCLWQRHFGLFSPELGNSSLILSAVCADRFLHLGLLRALECISLWRWIPCSVPPGEDGTPSQGEPRVASPEMTVQCVTHSGMHAGEWGFWRLMDGLSPQLGHLWVLWLWVGDLAFWTLSFFVCKMGMASDGNGYFIKCLLWVSSSSSPLQFCEEGSVIYSQFTDEETAAVDFRALN